MQKAITICKKELKVYFDSPIAYIFIVAFLVVATWIFFRTFFLVGEATLRGFFVIIPWLCLFFIPAVTMRLWAEERKVGTNELLFSLPVTEWQVVLGKYFAALIVYTITLLLTFPLAMTVAYLGNPVGGPLGFIYYPEWGTVLASYLGAFFLGSAILSIGALVSSVTTNQIVAFILGVIVVAGFLIVGEPIVTLFIPSALVPIAEYLGLGRHFMSISHGVIDSRDIIYYIILTLLPLYLTIKNIKGSKVG